MPPPEYAKMDRQHQNIMPLALSVGWVKKAKVAHIQLPNVGFRS